VYYYYYILLVCAYLYKKKKITTKNCIRARLNVCARVCILLLLLLLLLYAVPSYRSSGCVSIVRAKWWRCIKKKITDLKKHPQAHCCLICDGNLYTAQKRRPRCVCVCVRACGCVGADAFVAERGPNDYLGGGRGSRAVRCLSGRDFGN